MAKFLDTISPTLVKPITQAAVNRNAFGSPITYSNDRAKTLKADQGKTNTAETWVKLAVEMHESLGIDAEPEMYKHLFDSYKGFLGIAGEIWSDQIENPNKALHGKKETSVTQRLIGTFYSPVGQNAVSNAFYNAKGEADFLAKERASYEERKTADKHPLSEEEKAVLAWKARVENALKPREKRKRKLNQQRENHQISEAQFTQAMIALNQEIEQIQKTAVGQYRRIQGLRTTK